MFWGDCRRSSDTFQMATPPPMDAEAKWQSVAAVVVVMVVVVVVVVVAVRG